MEKQPTKKQIATLEKIAATFAGLDARPFASMDRAGRFCLSVLFGQDDAAITLTVGRGGGITGEGRVRFQHGVLPASNRAAGFALCEFIAGRLEEQGKRDQAVKMIDGFERIADRYTDLSSSHRNMNRVASSAIIGPKGAAQLTAAAERHVDAWTALAVAIQKSGLTAEEIRKCAQLEGWGHSARVNLGKAITMAKID